MKTSTVILIGIIVFALLAFYFGYSYFNKNEISTISVDGKSELNVKPDRARVYVGVSVLKPTAKEAQDEANKIINSIIEELDSRGIFKSSIETENLNLFEEKIWSQGVEKSNGWRATQNLRIKLTDFSKIGTVVDISVNNGANQINNIEFYLSDEKESEYKKIAISEATKNAREKAEAIASSSGAKIKKVKSISESNFEYLPYVYTLSKNYGAEAIKESSTVLPRDVTISANVNIVYEIQ